MTSDVVVIGGGIVGGTIAWRLAQAGVAVELLEAGRWGSEASWAGAGMLAPGGEVVKKGAGSSLAMDGRSAYAAYVAELTAASGTPIDFRECGAIELAADESEAATLRERMREQAELGIASQWLTAGDARARLPQLGASPSGGPWPGAAWYPGDAVVNPRELMHALAAACAALGVRVREQTTVAALDSTASHVEAHTASGETYSAGCAVLAAGAWSSHIKVNGAANLVESVPVRGHLLQFEMPPGWLQPILRHGHTYLFQRNSGAFIAGATTEHVGFHREIDPACVREIHDRAAQLLPALASVQPVEAWNGIRPASAQSGPVVGRAGASRLWTAYGHYRNGILMAPSTAAVVAGEITSSLGTM